VLFRLDPLFLEHDAPLPDFPVQVSGHLFGRARDHVEPAILPAPKCQASSAPRGPFMDASSFDRSSGAGYIAVGKIRILTS
jgi:hypothetical protein